MNLLEGNSWFNSRTWESKDRNGNIKVTTGSFLICDGGYHRWPSMMFPVKSGATGSPLMKWGCMVESIRKDIECVFGTLKKRFAYLKTFNKMRKQKDIDNAFVCCCILHNILLEDDGWLDDDLPNLQNGVKNRLAKLFVNVDPRGDAMTRRGDDDTVDNQLEQEEAAIRHRDETKQLAIDWKNVLEKLVDHYDYHATICYN